MKFSIKKEHFLNEAIKLIYLKGFKATTMRDIAEHMNFDASNSYNYVKSKQEILEVFLFGTSNEFHSRIDIILESNYNIKEKLKLVIKSHVEIASQKPYAVALLVNEWRNLKGEKYIEFVNLRNDYEQKISKLINEGKNEGLFKDMDLEIITPTFLSSIRWFYDHFTKDDAKLNPLELERQIVNYVLDGISLK